MKDYVFERTLRLRREFAQRWSPVLANKLRRSELINFLRWTDELRERKK